VFDLCAMNVFFRLSQ